MSIRENRDMLLVKTEYGELKGAACSGVENYIAFKGIPYAKPPLGELRFKAPMPPDPWIGVRDASEHGAVCPQFNERMNRVEPGSEDCLYLNVYTKSLQPKEPLSVMVWIHGGGFYTGSGNSDYYGPDFFMAHNVVLVTINYRLEVLGFLCLDTEEVPGNAGMKDQVMALKWIKNNIKVFGGDPNNITLFGCSAGSGSVSCHLISKMSRGLFHKAICQSGICLNEWCYNIYGRQRAFQLGKLLGKETDDPVELLNFLRSQPVSSLFRIELPSLENIKYNDLCDSILFGPVVEKAGPVDTRFLAELPYELVGRGDIANVPLIIGYTSGEGIEIARKLPSIIGYYAKEGSIVPRELKLKWPVEKIQEADEKIRMYYFKHKELKADSYQELSDLETDKMFLYNQLRYARYHSQYATEPVYFYKFVAETERNYTKRSYKMDFIKGVCHADDLPYQFNITCLDIPLTDESRYIIKQMVQLWVNFAATGKPTTNEEWRPFTDAERNYVVIGKTLEYYQNPSAENMKFWENIYDQLQFSTYK
ncbi:unnamed protein product [Arctia plantaginis]|uniref:Carboxylic ester hydrolase n=1 Tax=Arctia plantaginis TaxID=874455 RepID=A0A8S0YUS0_ARCPL|nr:unnamed protein product [Arctia plantaginis]